MNSTVSVKAEGAQWPPARVARWVYNWRALVTVIAFLGAINLMTAFGRLRIATEVEGLAPVSASAKLFMVSELAVGLGVVIAAFIALFKLPIKPVQAGRIITGFCLVCTGMGLLAVTAGLAWRVEAPDLARQVLTQGTVRLLLGLILTSLARPLRHGHFEWFGRMIARLTAEGVPEGLRRPRGDHRPVPVSYRIEKDEARVRLRPITLCGLIASGRVVLPERLEDCPPKRWEAEEAGLAMSHPVPHQPTVSATETSATGRRHRLDAGQDDAFDKWKQKAESGDPVDADQNDEFDKWKQKADNGAPAEGDSTLATPSPAQPALPFSDSPGVQREPDCARARLGREISDDGVYPRQRAIGVPKGSLPLIATTVIMAFGALYIYLPSPSAGREEGGRRTGSAITAPYSPSLDKHAEPAKPVAEALPIDQLGLLEAEGKFTDYGYFSANVYNGSEWTVEELTINVTLGDFARGTSRRVVIEGNPSFGGGTGKPLQYTDFVGRAGFVPSRDQKWTWSILAAKGQPDALARLANMKPPARRR